MSFACTISFWMRPCFSGIERKLRQFSFEPSGLAVTVHYVPFQILGFPSESADLREHCSDLKKFRGKRCKVFAFEATNIRTQLSLI